MDIKEYAKVSADVWEVFKKYIKPDADLNTWGDAVHALDEKYKGTAGYKFMQDLLKVYFQELVKIKG